MHRVVCKSEESILGINVEYKVSDGALGHAAGGVRRARWAGKPMKTIEVGE